MAKVKTKKWWASSANWNELSLTLKGILGSFIPLVIIAARFYGVDLPETTLMDFITEVGKIVTSVGLVVAGLATV